MSDFLNQNWLQWNKNYLLTNEYFLNQLFNVSEITTFLDQSIYNQPNQSNIKELISQIKSDEYCELEKDFGYLIIKDYQSISNPNQLLSVLEKYAVNFFIQELENYIFSNNPIDD